MLKLKLHTLPKRFFNIFALLPRRLLRLWQHVYLLFSPNKRALWQEPFQLKNTGWWLFEGLLLLLDGLGIAEIYETSADFFKYKTRPLQPQEISLAKEIFGDSISFDLVRLDEKAFVGPWRYHICYVSFYTINAWGLVSPSLLIHELMHVWQYERVGAAYIGKALKAQWSPIGYNYGGAEQLKKSVDENGHIFDFNFEQQADIVADYFRIKNGLKPHWGKGKGVDLACYSYFIEQIKTV